MNQDSPTIQVSKPIFLFSATLLIVLAITVSPKIEAFSETLALAWSIALIVIAIYLFIKGSRPIHVTLVPTGLEIDRKPYGKEQIDRLELNERYRQLTVVIEGAKTTYYLKRKGDLFWVRQALDDWSQRTGITAGIKDSWG